MGMSDAEKSRRYRQRHPDRVRVTKAEHRARHIQSIREYDRKSQVETRAARRAWLDAYKVSAGCTDCGYDAHPRALDFDHVGTDKVGDVGRMAHHRIAWQLIRDEIAKCEVVCANCHRIRTWMREQVEKPPAQVEGQSMFEFEDVS